MNEDSIKEKIIQSTIEILKVDTENITVRKIVAHAGVTQGLINYHFQTKDNLISIAVQRMVDETVSKVPNILEQIDGEPTEKLRQMMKMTLSYLVENPHISKISISRDMQSGNSKDNSQVSIDAFDKILQYIITDEKQRFLVGHIFCASIQSLFMRSDILLETQEFNIYNPIERNLFIDDLIDTVLMKVLI